MPYPFAPGEILTDTNLNAALGPSCVVSMTAAQSLANNSNVALSFATELYDPFAWHAGGAPTVITPATAGWYVVSLAGSWTSDGDYTELHVRLQKNGADVTPFVAQRWQGAAQAFTTPPFSVVSYKISMNGTTDSFRWLALHQNTSAAANSIDAVFTVKLMTPT